MIIEWLYSLHCKCRSFIRLFCYKYCQLDAHIASCSCYAERKYGNLAVPNAWVPANGSLLPRFQVWLIGAVKSRHFRSVLFSADAALRARVLFFFFFEMSVPGFWLGFWPGAKGNSAHCGIAQHRCSPWWRWPRRTRAHPARRGRDR